MTTHLKQLSLQFLIFLLLSLFFSVLPALLAMFGNTSSYAQALFNTWYGLLPPVALLLLAYLFYRKETNWMTFLGRAWFGVGIWFLLQLVFESLTNISPLLLLLSLPAKFTGGLKIVTPEGHTTQLCGWWLIASAIVFVIGGIALYIVGNRFKNVPPVNLSFQKARRIAFIVSTALLATFVVLTPLSIYAISRPTTGNFAQGITLPTEEEIFGYIKDVYDFGARRPGSDTYHQAATHLTDWFQRLSPKVTVERTQFDYWEEKEWQLVVDPDSPSPVELECFFVPYSGPTPSQGIKSELIYLGYGTETDFQAVDVKGKIALISLAPISVNWDQIKLFSFMAYDPDNVSAGVAQLYPIGWILHFFQIYPRLEQNGAAGAVFILENYPDMGPLAYYAPYDGRLRPVPCLYIREQDGEKLKQRLQSAPVQVKLVLNSAIAKGAGEALNIYTILPGKSESNVIVFSHFDSPWASAVEDSSGVGMVKALARYYTQVPAEDRERTMVFLLTGSHFVGTPSSKDFMHRHRNGILANATLMLGIEHIADNWPFSSYAEARGVFFEENPVVISLYAGLVKHYNLYNTLLFPTVTPLGVPTDAGPFNHEGIPIVSYISGPVYLFDAADTLERIPRDQLVPLAKLYIDFIENLNRYPDFMLRFNLGSLTMLLMVCIFSPLVAIGFASQRRRE